MAKVAIITARPGATIVTGAHLARRKPLDALPVEEAPSRTVARLEQLEQLPSA